MVCDPAVALVYPRLEASLALGQHKDAHPRPQVVVGRIVARKTAVTQSDALLGHHIVDVVVVSHEGAHHIAALDHRGEHAGVQRPGAFILGGTADMRIVGVPPCSDVFGQGDMEKRQRRQRLPAVGRGIGGAAGTIPAHLLLSKPTVAVDRRDC